MEIVTSKVAILDVRRNLNFTNPNNANYDAWIHWNVTGKCNFDCEYCFGHSAIGSQKVNSIDIKKLLNTLNKTGRIFRIGFTGGEPFLVPNFVEACNAITQSHFITINTHFTSNRVREFAEQISPERVLFIQAPLHFEELEKKNLIQKYVNNFHLLKKLKFNVFAEAVAYPPITKRLNEYRNYFEKEGIDFTFGAFTGIYNGKKYPESYTDSELKLFDLSENEENKFLQKGNICNAGYNVFAAFSNGNVFPCFQIKQRVGNLYKKISFGKSVIKCPAKYCGCPLNVYDECLFEKAL